MQLVGSDSNAVATVSDIRLILTAGTLISSFFIPDLTIPSNPTFETGTKTLKFTTSQVNSDIAGISDSMAEANFNASGNIDNIENTSLRIRNAEVENIRNESRTQLKLKID